MGAASAAAPRFSVADASVLEGAPGTTNVAKFKVTLSKPAPRKMTIDFKTVDGKAKAGKDYVKKDGTLTFRSGKSKKVVRVKVKGEDLYELNEAFFLKLSNPSSGRIDDGKGRGTITNDDDPPELSVSAETNVGEGGTADFSFVLSEASGVPVALSYDTANDSAEAGTDYNAVAGDVTIPPGDTESSTFGVSTIQDAVIEDNELFVLEANPGSSPHVTLDNGLAVIQILDNDGPTMSIENVTITESNVSQTVNVDVDLGAPHPYKTVTVNYATDDGWATAGQDYVGETGQLEFAPNDTTQTITITVTGDTLDEGVPGDSSSNFENFYINLFGAQNATIADGQGQVTINDDDPPPTLSISDVTVTEQDFNQAVFANVIITMSAPSGRQVAVNYATAPNTATTQPPPQDFGGTAGGFFFNPGGPLTFQISVPVYGDCTDETNETFFVNITSATNATILDGQGVVTITDDEPPAC